MLEDFLSYIECNLSVFREDKILLSVSGGIDSMVMLEMFRQIGFNITVAHINHSTRNGGSDHDMDFVKKYCERNDIPFRGMTLSYDHLAEGNFQENARKERFAFLARIKAEESCKWIATAHHKEDRWETFLMHLNRKSGIQGLTSLRPKVDSIIHPMLIFTKTQIIDYAQINKIDFVHDVSNDSDDYTRNAIRNQVTPRLLDIFPDFIEHANAAIQHLDHTSGLLEELVAMNDFVSKDQKTENIVIQLQKIKSFQHQQTLLYHILEKYGFNYSTCCDILETTTTGAQFETTEYEGLFDRGKLILRKRRPFIGTNLVVDSPGTYLLADGRQLKVEMNTRDEIEHHLWLDISKVKWPLLVRNIQPGDTFQPHGMKGATKTIKKLCSDLKINRFAKEKMLVVCQEKAILQVIGIRSSHEWVSSDIKNALTFKITD